MTCTSSGKKIETSKTYQHFCISGSTLNCARDLSNHSSRLPRGFGWRVEEFTTVQGLKATTYKTNDQWPHGKQHIPKYFKFHAFTLDHGLWFRLRQINCIDVSLRTRSTCVLCLPRLTSMPVCVSLCVFVSFLLWLERRESLESCILLGPSSLVCPTSQCLIGQASVCVYSVSSVQCSVFSPAASQSIELMILQCNDATSGK